MCIVALPEACKQAFLQCCLVLAYDSGSGLLEGFRARRLCPVMHKDYAHVPHGKDFRALACAQAQYAVIDGTGRIGQQRRIRVQYVQRIGGVECMDVRYRGACVETRRCIL